ncbi:hypothetical protein ACFS07_00185 [Undibacterium arcticum]
MPTTDYQRPPTLYRYDQRATLERALTQGEFRLQPATHCLTLSFFHRPGTRNYSTGSAASTAA